MAAYKNQHFVPRCLLRPFSLNGEGRALNLFNIRRRQFIENASLKGQASRHYMYGEDGQVEHELAKYEGGYVGILRGILERASLSSTDLMKLRFFTYLQFRRTEVAVKRLKQSYQQMNDLVGDEKVTGPVPTTHQLTLESLKLCFETMEYIEDLKVRVVENRSSVPFVTSDDPAALVNRFLAHKLDGRGYGMQSSGLILTMPLTPTLSVICYDGRVYTCPDLSNGRVVLKKDADAEALNELQYLRAAENVYFSHWSDREDVLRSFDRVRAGRREDWFVFKYLLPVPGQPGTFREADNVEEGKAAQRALIEWSFIYPTPSTWMSGLKFRSDPRTFSNGSAVGKVRKKAWLESDD
jgi:hypothetical protein